MCGHILGRVHPTHPSMKGLPDFHTVRYRIGVHDLILMSLVDLRNSGGTNYAVIMCIYIDEGGLMKSYCSLVE